MELDDIKGFDAIIEQAKIYSTISEQLADNMQDFKRQVNSQRNEGDYDNILSSIDEAESLIYKASMKLAEIEELNN